MIAIDRAIELEAAVYLFVMDGEWHLPFICTLHFQKFGPIMKSGKLVLAKVDNEDPLVVGKLRGQLGKRHARNQ